MGQANTSLTKPRSTNRPNTLRSTEGSSRIRKSLTDEDSPWRMSGKPHTKCFVRKLYRGHSIWHQCAWKKPCESNHKRCKDKEPSVLFVCRLEPKKPRYLKQIDKRCRTIFMKLIDHRHAMRCDCDLEYIKTNRTSCDMTKGSIICEVRDKAILKAITKHDKICRCGAFEFIQQEKESSTSPRTLRSSKTPNSSGAHESSKLSTPSKTPGSSKATASSKSTTPPKTPFITL